MRRRPSLGLLVPAHPHHPRSCLLSLRVTRSRNRTRRSSIQSTHAMYHCSPADPQKLSMHFHSTVLKGSPQNEACLYQVTHSEQFHWHCLWHCNRTNLKTYGEYPNVYELPVLTYRRARAGPECATASGDHREAMVVRVERVLIV